MPSFGDFERECRRWEVKQRAERDSHLALFRRIWESLAPRDKNELKTLLHTLEGVSSRLGHVTGWKLCAPNICTSTFEDCEELAEGDPLNQELAKSPSLYITPAEYLCAIACWDAGEDYVPVQLVWNHPRWPYIDPWKATDPSDPS